MPNSCGITALTNIMDYDPHANVVMATSIEHAVEDALRIGAKGYLMKPFKSDEILAVLRALVKQGVCETKRRSSL
ncbi:response regulator [Piscirickettsia litoralis]|uniref:response regulator n=1 Tax=Piscirickettsia litoralis TaxID=1891921 RepID=UPI001F1B0F41|nr:response regulator [Piscirickettsia litoralis]